MGLHDGLQLSEEFGQIAGETRAFTRTERLLHHLTAQVTHRDDIQLALERGNKKCRR